MAIPFAGLNPVPLNSRVEESFECLEIAFAPGCESLLGEYQRLAAHAHEGYAPEDRRNPPTGLARGVCGQGAGLVAPHTVMTTLPRAWPSLRYRIASGTSLNGKVLSTTGVILPASTSLRSPSRSSLRAVAINVPSF